MDGPLVALWSSMQIDGNNTSSSVETYDLVILGGGTGSTIAAWMFASQGQRVAVIERKYIGGSCPNIACLPSKKILHSARVVSYFCRGEELACSRTASGLTCRQCPTENAAWYPA